MRVSFTDDDNNNETATSAATEAVTARPNNLATGQPTISGTIRVGETLTASTSEISDEDGMDDASFSHQWLTDDAAILGATNSTYTLTDDEVGKAVKVRVTFTDDANNDETLTSVATVAVAAAPNRQATGQPTIGGTPQVDLTLTADTSPIDDEDGLTNVSYRYQWVAGGSDIDGATSSTYTLADADQGKTVRVRVTFTDDAGNDESLTSAETETVQARPNSPATGAPAIGGTPQVGETLTASTSDIADQDGLTNVSYRYQWTAGGSDIDGATGSSHTLTSSEQGQTVQVRVSFTDDAGNQESLTSAATEAVAPQSDNTVADEAVPVWSADMLVVEYSSVSIGAASADLFSNVGGSAGHQVKSLWSYTLGRDLRLAFTDGVPGAEDMTLQVGDLALAFPAGSSGESSFKWPDVDVDWEDGQTLPVRIVPRSSLAEPPANTRATGAPTISGTPRVGVTLTADTSNIADDDGLDNVSYSYQWIRSDNGEGTDIAGETDSTYTLVFADQGKTIEVKVSFTDDDDNGETLTSEATVEVAAAPNRDATGAPTISGTPQVEHTLTADTSNIIDEDGLTNVSYRYQWMADDVNIDGATGSTYVPANGDAGTAIKVSVSFTDDRNNAETRTSVATTAVAATVPTQPLSLTVATGDEIQELDASWQAPSSNGGADITGYKVQWKESADSWDSEADVSEATVTGTTYTITGLTGGTAYAVRVIATNSAGNGPASAEATGTPAGGTSQQQTGDSTSPTVSSIAITSDPGSDEVYAIGDAIQITVTFSADVTVAGKPQLELDIGGNAKPAEYQSTNASSTVFSYTVAEGDSDTDGIAVAENKLTLNGGTIKDASDNAADLDHVALEAQPGHKVDGVRPTISLVRMSGISSARMSGTRANVGDLVHASVDFTEEIFLDGSPHITLDIDSAASRVASLIQIGLYCPALEASTSDPVLAVNIPEGEEPPPGVTSYCFWSDTHGITMLFHHTVAKGELDTDGVGIPANSLSLNGGTLRDAAGNDAVITHEAVADNPSVLIDGVPPEITSIEITSDPGEDDTYAEGDTIKFNVTFSEDLEFFGFGWTRLRLDIGGKTRMAYQVRREILDIRSDETGYIMAYSYTVAAGDNDEDGISFPANALHKIWLTVLGTDGNHAIFENEAIAYNAEHKVATATTAEDDTDDTQKTGFLMISGTLNVGETVKADFSNVDDEDGVEYAVDTAYFDWSREGGGGGLHSRFDTRYIIAASDEGKRLNVSTWFFDDNGNEEYLYSPWTEPVGPSTSSNSDATGLPMITGTPQVDQTLTADTSSIADGDGLDSVSYSYQWTRSDNGADTDIAGETDSTYTLVLADLGKTIKVKVSFTDDADNDETLTSEATVAVAATVPSAPQSLTVTSGSQTQELDVSWQAPSSNGGSDVTGYKVQWKESADSWDTADAVSEATETGTTHTITGLTGGVEYAVRVIATNDVGDGPASTEAKGTPAGGVSEQVVEPENSAPTGLPGIGGTPQVDQTLTADTSPIDDEDGLTNVSYSYQWIAGGTDIGGATGSSYTLTASEQGKTIQVRVTFTDDANNEETLTSAATVAVAAAAPASLTAAFQDLPDSHDGSTTFTFRVLFSEDVGISYVNMRDDAFSLSEGDVTGARRVDGRNDLWEITVEPEDNSDVGITLPANRSCATTGAICTREDSPRQLTNSPTATVTGPAEAPPTNTSAAGAPTISGTPQVEQTLTADTSSITDEDGLTNVSYSYQWIAGGSDIAGATGSTYTLTSSEQGQTVQVRVTFTDDAGNDETLTSEATAAVAASDQTDPGDGPNLLSYITVVVAEDTSDPDNPQTDFTITWSDVDACSTGYNAYFSNSMDVARGGDTTHLGSAVTDGSQIASSLSNVEGEGIIFDVELYCGTEDSGRLVSSVKIPHDDGPSSEESNRRLVPGTYSSEPPLLALTISPGTLTPTFHGHTLQYTISDVVSDGARLTLVATAKPGYGVVFVKDIIGGTIMCSPWSLSCQGWNYQDGDGNQIYPLTDADADEPGFQVDLAAGEKISLHVIRAYGGMHLEDEFYGLTDTRVANTPATGAPSISGTPQVEETLTADTANIADQDGLTGVSYRYQWIAGGADISGATGASHTLTAAEEGQTIQVRVDFTDDAGNDETMTSAATVAVAPKPKSEPTGLPAITGTPQVGETLTADTSAISDEDGLANVSYQYQWLRDGADIAGQTNSTYTLVTADEGKTIRVRVTFRDDADNQETLTSAATTAVAARPTPAVLLTASFANVPDDHNGGNFTFQLNFSENVDAGYARIQDHAFTVTGATIDSASRITQGSNQGWNVEVNPTGNGAVSITLPETTDCSDSGAICTDDSRKLSHSTSAIVAGPPAISVSDAAVQEAEGAVLVFSVTLSHASSRTVTVGYATSDGTAQAGSDYTAASGTLTFNAGDTSQTIQVTVLTDSEDEGQEALTLTLSNPSQATLDDATGAGAIENGESSSGTQEDPPVVLLTGSFSNMPATHNGSAFTFDLSFSENVKAGYARIRDHAFTISGASTIASAVRKTQGSNQNWTITVQPGGNEDIVITLPSTTNCSSQRGICTYDDRMLSNEVRLTVTGPDGANSRDTTAPTISSVAMTSDPDENDADLGAYIVGRSGGSIVQSTNWASGVYRIGDDVQVTVTFSENVTVTGSPQLELAIGSNSRTAGYESTDGSAVVFSYTVAVGDSDSDGIAVAAHKLTLNGGSVKDAANNDADLSHNALTAQAGHEVDGVRPRLKLTVSDRLKFGASSGGTDGAYTTGEELIIRAAFTEGGVRGSVTGPPRVALNFDGGGPRVAKWDPSLIFNPTQYPLVRFFSYVVQEGDLDSDGPTIGANAIDLAGGFIRDAAGNDAVLTHSAVAASSSFIVDAVAPTVSSIAITSDPGDDDTYGTGDKIEVTVTFSENMSIPTSITCSSDVVHCKAELELDIGGTARTADYQSHDGAEVVYAYTVQAGDTDDNGIAIGDNKLTGQRIMDATGKFGYAINDADLSHDALADNAGHKVSGTS